MALAGSYTPHITRPELAVHISDFVITLFWIIGGILLCRRKGLGYVVGPGLLFQASMLFVGLIVILFFQPMLTSTAFAPSSVVVISLLGLICFVPFALIAQGITLRDKP